MERGKEFGHRLLESTRSYRIANPLFFYLENKDATSGYTTHIHVSVTNACWIGVFLFSPMEFHPIPVHIYLENIPVAFVAFLCTYSRLIVDAGA
jgi:hypothetical protein